MKLARALALVAAAVVPLRALFATSVACGVPTNVCSATKLVGKTDEAGAPDPACTSCMEDNCCDSVGHCQDDPGCADELAGAHACVEDAGGPRATARESACTGLLASTAKDGYDCMRARCGQPCGLPVCKLDPAAVLFVTPECDRCVTGPCCEEIDACYQNRTCKLAMECIIDECKGELAHELGPAAPTDINAAADIVCGTGPAPGATVDDFGGACIASCLARFAGPADGGLPVARGEQGPCLAFRVYACAVTAGCASKCEIDAGAPEDAGADASDGG